MYTCLVSQIITANSSQIVGLIGLILVVPAFFFSVARLRSQVEYPPAAAFVGVTAPFALFNTEKRVYLVSGILTQLLLSLGQILVTNGFSELRSISLCLVDAVLTSEITFGIAGVFLMIQIGAGGAIFVRAWLEQHIAKRESAGVQSMANVEKGETSKGSIETSAYPVQTSSFDRDSKTGFLNNLPSKFKISSPFNVKKEGPDTNLRSPVRARAVPDDDGKNPFASPADPEARRTYNPKTGGYEYQFSSAIDDNDYMYDIPGGRKGPTESSGRPSSELYTPSPLSGSKPKTRNVTEADLFPSRKI
jgi:hypothetical protein